MFYSSRFVSLVFAAALVSFGASCEKHSWEETKKLHHHGDGHAEEGQGGGHDVEGHDKADEQGHGAESH